MTREDAVTTLKDISEMVHKQKEIEKSTLYGILDSNNEPIEALDMAIKVLEQEPTTKENLVVEDCISRAELLKAIDTWDKFGVDDTNSLFRLDNLSLPHYVPYIHYDDVVKAIKGMPSIQPKTDEPMQVELEGDGYSDGKLVYDYGKCPKCGWEFEYGEKDWEEPYCCHCGQKLHWFESEDKE